MIDTTTGGVALTEDSPHPRAPYHDLITRSAAAAVYLSVPLGESILFTFFGRPGRAWGPAIGIDPVAVVRHAVAARRRRRFRDVLELIILATTAVVLLAGTITGFTGLVTDLAVALAGIALAWVSLVVSVFCTRRRAALIRDAAGRSAELGRPLKPAIEDRLRESARANLIVYAESRADQPFVGSGRRIHDWELAVDVTRGAGPVPFTIAELDEYLDLSFLDDPTEHLTCPRRLYVDGRTVRPALDDPLQHLGLDVALARVAAENDSSRRVYLCLQQTAREGQIVVTLFVRPRLEGRLLRLEVALHALLPLAGRVANPVARLSSRPLDVLGRSMSIAGRLLPGPIGRLRSDIRRVRWQAARKRQAQRAGRSGRPFDLGATITVREGMSTDDLGALPEIVTIGAALQDSLLSTLRGFLIEHRIDTTEFDRMQQAIVTTAQAEQVVGFGADNDFGFTADE